MTWTTKVDRKMKKLQKSEVFHLNICLSELPVHKAVVLGGSQPGAGEVHSSVRLSTWPLLGHREQKRPCKIRALGWAMSQQPFKIRDNSVLRIWHPSNRCRLAFLPSTPHGKHLSSGCSWLLAHLLLCQFTEISFSFGRVFIVYH